MHLIIAENEAEQAALAADEVERAMHAKPDCCLGLSTGSSPLGMYNELVRRFDEGKLDFSAVSSINLDEYIGLGPEHPQSFCRYMNDNFFRRINIKPENTYVASGVGNTEDNIREVRERLDGKELDLLILGVGADGHLGFNEPGDVLYDRAHQESLTQKTIADNSRFFDDPGQVPTSALTMGIGEIMRARKLLLIISGEKRAAAGKLLCDDVITPRCPVTFLKLHRDVTVIITRKLADELKIA